jgi:glycosyltransferase involved in cell wall biosynthesis
LRKSNLIIEPNILFVADVPLENPISGSEQVLFQQAYGLVKLGFKVKALTRQNGNMPLMHRKGDGGIEEWRYSARPGNPVSFIYSSLRNPFKQFEFISQSEILKVAVCHHPFTYFSLLSTGRLRHIPSIHMFHSPTHLEYELLNENRSTLKNFFPVKARYWVEKYCHRNASKIMVLSHYMKRLVHNLYNIPKDKITVNPGGVDLDYFDTFHNRQMLKRELGFNKGKIHLLSIRNHEPRMGLDNLIKAADLLRQKDIGFHLIVGGDGPEKEKIKCLINDYQLNDVVTLTGFIPSGKLSKYYAAADFFILPTRKLEGFGLVTPESMACGTPVLGTPVGGTKEILLPFNSQFLFMDSSPEAIASGIQRAINRYFNDQNEYKKLRSGCREYVEKNYSWQRHIEQLISIITETSYTNNQLRN